MVSAYKEINLRKVYEKLKLTQHEHSQKFHTERRQEMSAWSVLGHLDLSRLKNKSTAIIYKLLIQAAEQVNANHLVLNVSSP